jgi:hypothetical protein
MSFEEFVKVFEEGQADSFRKDGTEDVEYPQLQTSRLSNVELEARLRQKIEDQSEVLQSVRSHYRCIHQHIQ